MRIEKRKEEERKKKGKRKEKERKSVPTFVTFVHMPYVIRLRGQKHKNTLEHGQVQSPPMFKTLQSCFGRVAPATLIAFNGTTHDVAFEHTSSSA